MVSEERSTDVSRLMWASLLHLAEVSRRGSTPCGWFASNEFSVLAFDETELRLDSGEIPEPSSLVLLAIVAGAGLGVRSRRRRR